MLSKISVRWQTVIPREIREELGIEPNGFLDWEIQDGVIHVYPVPSDPLRASLGMLRNELRGGTEDLLEERRREREREAEMERRLGVPPPPERR